MKELLEGIRKAFAEIQPEDVTDFFTEVKLMAKEKTQAAMAQLDEQGKRANERLAKLEVFAKENF